MYGRSALIESATIGDEPFSLELGQIPVHPNFLQGYVHSDQSDSRNDHLHIFGRV
jgi:hypothetical protein